MPETTPDTPGTAQSAPDPTLVELWRRTASRASDARLAGLAALGAVAAAAAVTLGLGVVPGRVARWWPLLLPGIAAGAFGLWGIAAREEAERRAAGADAPAVVVALAALRWLAVAAAAAALGLALILALGVALGVVRS